MAPVEITEKPIVPLTPEEQALADQGYKKLEIKAKCVYEDDKLLDHVKRAMILNIPHFAPTMHHDHEMVIVGSGPSLRDTFEEVGRLKEAGCYIAAVKGAHDFLIDRDIIPHIAVAVDPQPHIRRCFTKHRDDVAYFIASQCNPDFFYYLRKRKCVLWHLFTGKEGEKDAIKGEVALGGGSTSGLRAITLGWMMGFRKFHLFGFDSCLTGDDLKVHQKWEGPIIDILTGGEKFSCNPAMAAQVTEYEKILALFKNQAQFKVYGKGAIPHLAGLRAARGLPDSIGVGCDFRPIAIHEDYWKPW